MEENLIFALWFFSVILLVILLGFFGYIIIGIKIKAIKNCPYEHYTIYQVGPSHYAIKLQCKVLFFWTWLWLRDTETHEVVIIRQSDHKKAMREIRDMMNSRQSDRYRKSRYIYSR